MNKRSYRSLIKKGQEDSFQELGMMLDKISDHAEFIRNSLDGLFITGEYKEDSFTFEEYITDLEGQVKRVRELWNKEKRF